MLAMSVMIDDSALGRILGVQEDGLQLLGAIGVRLLE
jgi:hypothetical protein